MRINRTRRSEGLPHLAQLVEHLTVVGKNNVSADIRVSPVQVREWGPTHFAVHILQRLILDVTQPAQEKTLPLIKLFYAVIMFIGMKDNQLFLYTF